MNGFFNGTERIAGAALLLSILSILVGLLVVATQGKFRGLAAAFMGVEGFGASASALAVMTKAGLPFALLQAVGFGILAAQLRGAGEASIATVSFGFLIFALSVSSIEGTFQGSVTVWAGQQWARTGSAPEMYEALRTWINGSIQPVYIFAYLAAMAGFSLGILRTRLLAPWVGWLSLGWSIFWIVGYMVVGIPAVIIMFPLIYGIGLLL